VVVAEYVAERIGVADGDCLARYSQGREANRHRKHARAICERYGYRTYAHAREQLLAHLRARCEAAAERPSVIFDMATGWLREHRVLLPGATTLERDVAAVRDRAERELWARIATAVDAEQRQRLEALLAVPYGSGVSGLARLRRAPTSISAPGLVGALARLRELRALDVGPSRRQRLAGEPDRGARALRRNRQGAGDRPAHHGPPHRDPARDRAASGVRARRRAGHLRPTPRAAARAGPASRCQATSAIA
jgi:hypothetical protein